MSDRLIGFSSGLEAFAIMNPWERPPPPTQADADCWPSTFKLGKHRKRIKSLVRTTHWKDVGARRITKRDDLTKGGLPPLKKLPASISSESRTRKLRVNLRC